MSRIRTKLAELTDADVKFVSLVGRGANRIPFRIIKSNKESNMGVDLSSIGLGLGRAKKSAPVMPEIAGVVVFDHGDATNRAIKSALSANGFYTDNVKKFDDGTLMYQQAADMPQEGEFSVVRLSEQMAVVVKGFDPWAGELTDNANFSDMMATQGFYQGMRTACDALCATVGSVLMKAESPADAVKKMEDSIGAFGSYLTTLVKGLPVAAFKADEAVLAAVKADQPKGQTNGKEKPGEQDDDKGLGELAGDGTPVNPAASSPSTNDAFGQIPAADQSGIANQSPTGGNGFGQIPGKDIPNVAKKDDAGEGGTASGTNAGESVTDPDGDGDNDQDDYCKAGGKLQDWKDMGHGKRVAWSKANAKGKDTKEKSEMAELVALVVKAALGDVTKALDGIKNTVESVQKAQETTDARIDQIARKAEDASKAVKGFVVGGPPSGDVAAQGEAGSAQKSEASPYTGTFDTAMIRKSARR